MTHSKKGHLRNSTAPARRRAHDESPPPLGKARGPAYAQLLHENLTSSFVLKVRLIFWMKIWPASFSGTADIFFRLSIDSFIEGMFDIFFFIRLNIDIFIEGILLLLLG